MTTTWQRVAVLALAALMAFCGAMAVSAATEQPAQAREIELEDIFENQG